MTPAESFQPPPPPKLQTGQANPCFLFPGLIGVLTELKTGKPRGLSILNVEVNGLNFQAG